MDNWLIFYFVGVTFNLLAYHVDKKGVTTPRFYASFLSWVILILGLIYLIFDIEKRHKLIEKFKKSFKIYKGKV